METAPTPDDASRKQRCTAIVVLCLLVLAGAGLRFSGLGDKALWLDEVFTMVRTHQAGPAEILERVKTNERHPPLFHLLSAPFLRPGHGDAAVRLLPALASTLAVLLTGLLAWRMFGRGAGLAAAALAACSSLEVTVAQDYPMTNFWGRLTRAFYKGDTVRMTGRCNMENHYSLYLDDKAW